MAENVVSFAIWVTFRFVEDSFGSPSICQVTSSGWGRKPDVVHFAMGIGTSLSTSWCNMVTTGVAGFTYNKKAEYVNYDAFDSHTNYILYLVNINDSEIYSKLN